MSMVYPKKFWIPVSITEDSEALIDVPLLLILMYSIKRLIALKIEQVSTLEHEFWNWQFHNRAAPLIDELTV